MIFAFYQLLRPTAYLAINEYGYGKCIIDWIIPFILSLIIISIFTNDYFIISWLAKDSFIDDLKSFLQLLPGFYLTSLAAIATFDKKELDLLLPEPAPRIKIIIIANKRKTKKSISLTRRRLLSYLFGYLAFLCLALYLTTIFAPFLILLTSSLMSESYLIIFYTLCKFLFLLFFFQMIGITVFGLYQLCERIHTVDNS